MTQEVWWYVLAGFIVGFGLSTLWEWLYFRRKRMRIEQRRIAELEATVRSLSQPPTPPPPTVPVGIWSPSDYESPGVLLETETNQINVPAPTANKSPAIASPARPVPVAQAVANYRAGTNGSDYVVYKPPAHGSTAAAVVAGAAAGVAAGLAAANRDAATTQTTVKNAIPPATITTGSSPAAYNAASSQKGIEAGYPAQAAPSETWSAANAAPTAYAAPATNVAPTAQGAAPGQASPSASSIAGQPEREQSASSIRPAALGAAVGAAAVAASEGEKRPSPSGGDPAQSPLPATSLTAQSLEPASAGYPSLTQVSTDSAEGTVNRFEPAQQSMPDSIQTNPPSTSGPATGDNLAQVTAPGIAPAATLPAATDAAAAAISPDAAAAIDAHQGTSEPPNPDDVAQTSPQRVELAGAPATPPTTATADDKDEDKSPGAALGMATGGAAVVGATAKAFDRDSSTAAPPSAPNATVTPSQPLPAEPVTTTPAGTPAMETAAPTADRTGTTDALPPADVVQTTAKATEPPVTPVVANAPATTDDKDEDRSPGAALGIATVGAAVVGATAKAFDRDSSTAAPPSAPNATVTPSQPLPAEPVTTTPAGTPAMETAAPTADRTGTTDALPPADVVQTAAKATEPPVTPVVANAPATADDKDEDRSPGAALGMATVGAAVVGATVKAFDRDSSTAAPPSAPNATVTPSQPLPAEPVTTTPAGTPAVETAAPTADRTGTTDALPPADVVQTAAKATEPPVTPVVANAPATADDKDEGKSRGAALGIATVGAAVVGAIAKAFHRDSSTAAPPSAPNATVTPSQPLPAEPVTTTPAGTPAVETAAPTADRTGTTDALPPADVVQTTAKATEPPVTPVVANAPATTDDKDEDRSPGAALGIATGGAAVVGATAKAFDRDSSTAAPPSAPNATVTPSQPLPAEPVTTTPAGTPAMETAAPTADRTGTTDALPPADVVQTAAKATEPPVTPVVANAPATADDKDEGKSPGAALGMATVGAAVVGATVKAFDRDSSTAAPPSAPNATVTPSQPLPAEPVTTTPAGTPAVETAAPTADRTGTTDALPPADVVQTAAKATEPPVTPVVANAPATADDKDEGKSRGAALGIATVGAAVVGAIAKAFHRDSSTAAPPSAPNATVTPSQPLPAEPVTTTPAGTPAVETAAPTADRTGTTDALPPADVVQTTAKATEPPVTPVVANAPATTDDKDEGKSPGAALGIATVGAAIIGAIAKAFHRDSSTAAPPSAPNATVTPSQPLPAEPVTTTSDRSAVGQEQPLSPAEGGLAANTTEPAPAASAEAAATATPGPRALPAAVLGAALGEATLAASQEPEQANATGALSGQPLAHEVDIPVGAEGVVGVAHDDVSPSSAAGELLPTAEQAHGPEQATQVSPSSRAEMAPPQSTVYADKPRGPTGEPAISPDQIDALVASIQQMVDKMGSRYPDLAAAGAVPAKSNPMRAQSVPLTPPLSDPYVDTAAEGEDGTFVAKNLSRSEYAVVRLMQSVRQLMRELKSLYLGSSPSEPLGPGSQMSQRNALPYSENDDVGHTKTGA